jgi:hypothetical protein
MDYSEEETKQRMEAALRGARIAGHKPMESLTRKRDTAQSVMDQDRLQRARKRRKRDEV